MIASWIVATHFRPRLLRAALASIRDNAYPDGWTPEIIVAHLPDDQTVHKICEEFGARTIESRQITGAGKRNAALKAATGDLVLVADDDDYQSPHRAVAAIHAFEQGYAISEIKEFRYLHLESGNVVRWDGRGTMYKPAAAVGTARNYRRSLLTKVGGWKLLPRLIEKDIQARINSRFPGKTSRSYDLGIIAPIVLAQSTVCIQHDANIWDDRPDIGAGDRDRWRGEYYLQGEGHWSVVPWFPRVIAERLGLS